jgi:hypothetical protein
VAPVQHDDKNPYRKAGFNKFHHFALVGLDFEPAQLGAGMKKIVLIGVGISGAALMAIMPVFSAAVRSLQ